MAVFEYGLRWMSVLIDLALVQNRRGYSGDLSQANPRMAGGSPQHHLGWLGYCLGDCSGAPLLAAHFEVIGMGAGVWLKSQTI